MNCRHIRRYLSDYIEGGLEKGIHKEVEWHIKRCKRCSQEVSELKDLLNITGRMHRINASADFEEKLKRRIVLDTIPQNRKFPNLDFLRDIFHSGSWLKPVAVASLIILVLFMRVNILTNRLLKDTHIEILKLNREINTIKSTANIKDKEIFALRHIIKSEIYLPQEMERLYKKALFHKQVREFDTARKLLCEITAKCPYKDISRKAREELRDMPIEEPNGI